MNIYLSVTLVGEYCSRRRLFLKRGYSEAIVKVFFVFKIFINIDSGERGRRAYEVLVLGQAASEAIFHKLSQHL